MRENRCTNHRCTNHGLGWSTAWMTPVPALTASAAPGATAARSTAAGSATPTVVICGGERAEVFVLSGAEDLVPVDGSYPGRVRYRPRTEGLFARIEHVRDASGDFWEVRSKDGLLTRYGTPRPDGAAPGWRDPAAVTDPGDPTRVFGWRITQTRDLLGNLIRYDYLRDGGQQAGHRWDHALLARISYADYDDDRVDPSFLVTVEFDYEPRPDPFSDHRSGFEIRTSLRCKAIRVITHAVDGVARVARETRFGYQQAGFNGASLLARHLVVAAERFNAFPGSRGPRDAVRRADVLPAVRRVDVRRAGGRQSGRRVSCGAHGSGADAAMKRLTAHVAADHPDRGPAEQPNRDAAATLSLSPETTEGHLGRAYCKPIKLNAPHWEEPRFRSVRSNLNLSGLSR